MNSEASRQNEYNCSRCRRKSLHETQRKCFWHDDKVELIARQKVRDPDSKEVLIETGERFLVDVDGVMDLIIIITDAYPEMSSLTAVRAIFPELCPRSIGNAEIAAAMNMESFCREYNLRPLGDDVGYLDYPDLAIDIFGTIASARERVQMQELKDQKSKAKAGK